ncbi:MAG: bifunctional adenosylcobinamide kinase/adenosylcobinamide-phosphate guanylyltransferase [Defluviitaleaceae bacterium]|nr:bifunctional adenosylcobinamide kinase/adenosylcobinamide-phosphate guanylyltransferase [Defluviitaleaceae bacterium]
MRIFISGGCKNGKSTYAQQLAKHQNNPPHPIYYVATMAATDHEDEERIARHQHERDGWGFTTVEQPKNIEGILTTCNHSGSFLLDSLTALLANEMFLATGEVDSSAYEKIATGLSQVLSKVSNIVIVSDYIYSDAFIYDSVTEDYRKSLAYLDRFVAKHCDVVLEAAYTQIVIHKGEGMLNAIY